MIENDLISRSALKEEIGKLYGIPFEEMADDFTWLKAIDSVDTPRLCQTPSLYAAEPIKNIYKKVVDNGSTLFECPSCKCRIVVNAFNYAVGCLGYAFCPYCGFDVREKEEKNYEDSQL